MVKIEKNVIIEGMITETLPNTMFTVVTPDGRSILAIPSGKMRRSFMRFLPGDKVKVELTPYDEKRGRIVGKGGR